MSKFAPDRYDGYIRPGSEGLDGYLPGLSASDRTDVGPIKDAYSDVPHPDAAYTDGPYTGYTAYTDGPYTGYTAYTGPIRVPLVGRDFGPLASILPVCGVWFSLRSRV